MPFGSGSLRSFAISGTNGNLGPGSYNIEPLQISKPEA